MSLPEWENEDDVGGPRCGAASGNLRAPFRLGGAVSLTRMSSSLASSRVQ